MRKWLFLKKKKKLLKLRFLNILKFSLFSFFRFKYLFLSEFSTIGWNWSEMFTFDPYYPFLAIPPFPPNGSFTYELPHMFSFHHQLVCSQKLLKGWFHWLYASLMELGFKSECRVLSQEAPYNSSTLQYFVYGYLLSLLPPLLGEIDKCAHWLLCKKFNNE